MEAFPLARSHRALFLRQSYLDSYAEYARSLEKPGYPAWDYVIITASNNAQAAAYTEQIERRLKAGLLPGRTHYAVLPDPGGKRVGSGGATLNAIRYVREHAGETGFSALRALVIHSGGDSKRIPQYSACGKLFSPVPRELPDGRRSTLFDEFIIAMTGVPARMQGGMMVCSGDVLLLFNPLQIDFYGSAAAALSIKEDVQTGKDHGVYLRDGAGRVGRFLHKQSVETLTALGAVNELGKVDIDTGAVLLGGDMLEALYGLIAPEGAFDRLVSEEVRLSFYGDFLYPLASESTLEQFYREKPEGAFTGELREARTALWRVLHGRGMRLICLSPGAFIHFGTTGELRRLMTRDMEEYAYLDWSRHVHTNTDDPRFAASNSLVDPAATVGEGCYLEDCEIGPGAVIGAGSVVSGVSVPAGACVPENTVLHGLRLQDGTFAARFYGVDDNPKQAVLFGKPIAEPLWTSPVHPVRKTAEEAVRAALGGFGGPVQDGVSLSESFRRADTGAILSWQVQIGRRVLAARFLAAIDAGVPADEVARRFERSGGGVGAEVEAALLETAKTAAFSREIRIYYYLSRCRRDAAREALERRCFDEICRVISAQAVSGVGALGGAKIAVDEVVERLPVRVNFGGGWSDTPPHCLEAGGVVLNAAITLEGRLPVEAVVRRLPEYKVVLASTDNGSEATFTELSALQNCRDPHDPFTLHKAGLIAGGVLPLGETDETLETILRRMGGGIYLSTRVIDIPRGSGLGTSSILGGAVLKALYRFLGVPAERDALYQGVLCMEQLMSTGGGWQDQAGGLTPGVKLLTSAPGMEQAIHCEPLRLSAETLAELNERFCLIYTGQRRLARNLLREIVGKYVGNDPDVCDTLREIQTLALQMRRALEEGDVDRFAALLDAHWLLSQRMDRGCTNTCIDQIFLTVQDLLDARMICGAGGGGFLQAVLKKGVTKKRLQERLNTVFADAGVTVWGCEFY